MQSSPVSQLHLIDKVSFPLTKGTTSGVYSGRTKDNSRCIRVELLQADA